MNPDCVLYDGANTLPKSTVIYGYEDSFAQIYAEEQNRQFVLLELGDADLNGEISILDVTSIQLHIAQLQTINKNVLKLADTDRDNAMSIMDATQVQLYIAQLIPEL